MQWWSWLLALIGASGTLLIGKKNSTGWVVLFINEVLWTVYSIITQQYGFIVAVVMYSIVYIKSFVEWKEEDKNGNRD
jgi:hypothetical protein